jgi:hypothetical protein
VRARWVAPTEDGGLLIDPPLADAPRLFDENRKRFAASDVRILGQSLQELRERAQQEFHLARLLWLPLDDPRRPDWKRGPVIVAGHQPDLFHPGVWLKNFVLNGIARRLGANPLNLIIDSDTIKSTSLRVPVWNAHPTSVRTTEIPFDEWTGEVPFASRAVQDRDCFFAFPDRVMDVYQPPGDAPLLARFWKRATERYNETAALRDSRLTEDMRAHGIRWDPVNPRTGDCFAVARRGVEREWGCFNFELAIGTALFPKTGQGMMLHILSDLPRFHAIYNECVRDYRRRHRLRSRNHPVPELMIKGDLFEAPFWVDDAYGGRLGRLMVRRHGDRLDLNYGVNSESVSVQAGNANDYADSLLGKDWIIRTRALTTTLISRLLFSDLFIHGIGGAKYDEVTDNIIRRYFGMEPPAYMVVSGTLRLPFPPFRSTRADVTALQHRQRDLQWNPQRFAPPGAPDIAGLTTLWHRWANAKPAGRNGRREQFRALKWLNEELRKLVPESERERVRAELETRQQELAANEILQRRDYAFCLYPEDKLWTFCTQLL